MSEPNVPKEKHRDLSRLASVARCVLYGFIIAFFSLPVMGLGTALPFAILIGLLAGVSVAKAKRQYFYVSTALLTFLFTILYDYGMKRACVMTVLNTVTALLAVLAVRAFKTARAAKSEKTDPSVRIKSLAVLVIASAAALGIYLFGTGNVVGWAIENVQSSRYIGENYGDTVKAGHTFYSPENGLYLTEITYEGSGGARSFLSAKNDTHFARDDYRAYCLDTMMPDFKGYYQRSLQYKTETMDVLFPHDTAFAHITPADSYTDYLPYAVCVIRDENYINAEDDFRSIYHYAFDTERGADRGFGNESIVCERLVLAGRDIATGQMYFAVKKPGEDTVFPEAKQTYKELHNGYGFTF